MRVVVFEAPGGGRDATVSSLARALAVPQTSLGDLMRAHLSQGTELGIRVSEIMNSGSLVPDEILTAVIHDGLYRMAHAGFLLLGYPHRASQALALEELLRELDAPLDSVLHLHLPEAEVERRIRLLAARRRCRNDRTHRFEPEVDHLLVEGACNVCGGELYQHGDEAEISIRGRFMSYEAMLEPITQHYARQDLLVTVDAVGPSDEILRRALAALQERSP
ncbi:adenylate kinase family protein [Streptomyces sp. NPDC015532]|uniref:adenylate kinase family protein n=1 Tax=Streptomyces sp. NPDC015532 TaxID=3364960 RepID=UPI0036FC8F64